MSPAEVDLSDMGKRDRMSEVSRVLSLLRAGGKERKMIGLQHGSVANFTNRLRW